MSSTPETSPILIIGGGPSGLAAALTLAQNGVPIRIIEKVPEFHRSSRGSGLHPRTLEFFRFLGVAEDAKRLGGPSLPVQRYKLPGGTEPVAKWRILDDTPATPDRPEQPLILSQYLTEGILRHHLAKYGVHVELSTEAVSLEQDETGVNVTLKHTDTNKIETVRVAYVIGCDGARGFTRKAIGATFEGETKESDGIVFADVEAEGITTTDVWHIWNVPGEFMIAMRPKKEQNQFHALISCQNYNHDPIDLLDPSKFVEFFHEHTGRRDIVFNELDALTYWKPKMRMVNKLHEGRVFIAGDAAHVHSPTGGQGLNTSVGDSFNITWKLALVHKGLVSRDLLNTYDVERLPVIARMLSTTSILYNKFAKGGDANEAAEGNGASGKEGSGFIKWREPGLRQLDINYRWSPIVFDHRGKGDLNEDELKARAYVGYPGEPMRAGDRAPEAPGLVDATGKETSLFEVFKPYRHTLLVFVPPGATVKAKEIGAAVQASSVFGASKVLIIGDEGVPTAVDGASTYHDKEGHAQKAYGVDGQTLTAVIVRPDGYIGAFVHDVDGLQTYMSRVVGVL